MNLTYTMKVIADPEQAARLGAGEWRELGVALWNNTTKTQARYMPIVGMEPDGSASGQPLQMLESAGMLSTLLPALQVANIAVSAAGTALVLRKLGQLDRKLDVVLNELRTIGEDARWIREVLDADLLARIRAAARRLSLPVLGTPEELRAALRDLIDAGEILDERRSLLLANGRGLAETRVIETYAGYLGHCVQMQLATCWRLGDAASAIEIGRDWAERFSEASAGIGEPILAGTENVRQLARYAALPGDRRKSAAAAARTLRAAAVAVQRQAERIEALDAHGLRASDLDAIEAAYPGRLVLLEFSEADVPT